MKVILVAKRCFILISLSPIALAAMGITLTLACRHSRHPWIIHLIIVPLMVIAAPATVMFISPDVPCPDEVCSTPQSDSVRGLSIRG